MERRKVNEKLLSGMYFKKSFGTLMSKKKNKFKKVLGTTVLTEDTEMSK